LDNIIPLNPTEQEEITSVYEKMVARRAQAKKSKKDSKKREATVTSANGDSKETTVKIEASSNSSNSPSSSKSNGSSISSNLAEPPVAKKGKFNGAVAGAAIAGASSSKIRPTTSTNGKVGSTANASSSKIGSTSTSSSISKGASSYSVSKDPNASEVYKSLFTTHNTADTQQRAHWITYNPFYN